MGTDANMERKKRESWFDLLVQVSRRLSGKKKRDKVSQWWWVLLGVLGERLNGSEIKAERVLLL